MADKPLLENPETWVAVAFGLFLILFAKYALSPIVRALDARSGKIAAELAEAQKLRAEAEALLASYKQKEADALEGAKRMVSNARTAAEAMKQQAAAEMKAIVARRILRVDEKIARAEAQAIETIRERIIDIATDAARKAVADQLNNKEDPAIIEAVAHVHRIVH